MALHRFVLAKIPVAKLPSLAVRYYRVHPRSREETRMATPERRSGIGGISVGGIIVVVGILTMIFWSIVLGLIITLVGLIAFGGFARGRWY
jgi:hypothetical protein